MGGSNMEMANSRRNPIRLARAAKRVLSALAAAALAASFLPDRAEALDQPLPVKIRPGSGMVNGQWVNNPIDPDGELKAFVPAPIDTMTLGATLQASDPNTPVTVWFLYNGSTNWANQLYFMDPVSKNPQ